jgi:hypothetical protein
MIILSSKNPAVLTQNMEYSDKDIYHVDPLTIIRLNVE